MNFRTQLQRPLMGIAACVIFGVLTLVYFTRFIPYDFDEFVAYRPISCFYYPLNRLHQLRLPCGSLDLSVLGSSYLPLRAFDYIGSVQSVLYFPLFLAWPSPISARLFGLLSLFVQALILKHHFRFPLWKTFLVLIVFFPYSFQHLVDTGQLSWLTTLTLLSWFLTLSLVQRESSRNVWFQWSLLGLLTFIGVFWRLSFLFVVPALMLAPLILLTARGVLTSVSPPKRISLLSAITMSYFTTFLPLLLLFSATDRSGAAYLSIITSNQSFPAYSFDSVLHHAWLKMSPFLFNPLKSSHVIFLVPDSLDWSALCLWGLFIAVAVRPLLNYSKHKRECLLGMVSFSLFLLTLITAAVAQKSWAMHHFVFAFPFLILSFCYFLASESWRGARTQIVLPLLCLGISFFYRVAQFDTLNNGIRGFPEEMDELNQYVNQYGTTHYTVVVGYGFSHMKSLYGPRAQGVAYTHQFTERQDVLDTYQMLRGIERKALFVVRGDEQAKWIASVLPTLRDVTPELKIYPWRVLRE